MDFKDLVKSREEEDNPFKLLGIEPWIFNGFDMSQLKRFLKSYRSFMASYHHPDRFLDEAEKKSHEYYFKSITSGIDKLLEDDYYFRECLEEVKTEGIANTIVLKTDARENSRLKKAMNSKEQYIGDLKNDLDKQRNAYEIVAKLPQELRTIEALVIDSLESLALTPDLRCDMTYANFHGLGWHFAKKFQGIIEKTGDPFELEKSARDFILEYVNNTSYFSEEEKKKANLAENRVIRSRRTGKTVDEETIILSKKQWPLFDVSVKGKGFTQIHRHGEKGESKTDYTIIGGVSSLAIKKYSEFYSKSFIPKQEPSIFGDKSILSNFSFSGYSEKCAPRLDEISPFVSNFMFPNSFLLVNSLRKDGRRKRFKESYELIVPIKVSKVRYGKRYK